MIEDAKKRYEGSSSGYGALRSCTKQNKTAPLYSSFLFKIGEELRRGEVEIEGGIR
jgi:hypothetical protein